MAPQRDPKYLAFIRSLPCSVEGCRQRWIEAHHTGIRGMSQKADDRSALPLCRWHHTIGPKSIHQLGTKAFLAYHQLDLLSIRARLQEEYTHEHA